MQLFAVERVCKQSLSEYGHMVATVGVAPTLAHLSGEYSAVKLCGIVMEAVGIEPTSVKNH